MEQRSHTAENKKLPSILISIVYRGFFCWNALPSNIKITCSVATLKSKALQHFRTDGSRYVLNLKYTALVFQRMFQLP